jgi:hypothetical protein
MSPLAINNGEGTGALKSAATHDDERASTPPALDIPDEDEMMQELCATDTDIGPETAEMAEADLDEEPGGLVTGTGVEDEDTRDETSGVDSPTTLTRPALQRPDLQGMTVDFQGKVRLNDLNTPTPYSRRYNQFDESDTADTPVS